VNVVLGPCRCQGCGEEVVLVIDADERGWLHANGELRCSRNRARGRRPYATRHGYRLVPPTLVPFIDWGPSDDDPAARRKREWARWRRAQRA
jgi:hypothetical protein